MSFTLELNRLAAATLLALAGASQAAIVEGADVGGFRTFVDTATGLVWADLDNAFESNAGEAVLRFSTYGGYLAALTAAGFIWADNTAVYGNLLPNAPLTLVTPGVAAAEYAGYAAVMMSLRPTWDTEGISSGLLQIGIDNDRNQWTGSTHMPPAGVDFLNQAPTRMIGGLWAYLGAPGSGGGVPLPGTLALAGLGLAALSARPASRRRATA